MENHLKSIGKLRAGRRKTDAVQWIKAMHEVTYPKWLESDLRTDHAGETGAI